jgi:hypothetical protein
MLDSRMKIRFVAMLFTIMFILEMSVISQAIEESGIHKYNLPGEVDKTIVACNGNLLLLQMNKLSKIAIFDINSEKIIDYISFEGSNNAFVTSTSNSIILFLADKNSIQRWSIEPLKKTLTSPIPISIPIHSIACGYAGNGPIMMMTKEGPKLLNTTTLKLIKIEPLEDEFFFQSDATHPTLICSSADGLTFAGWTPGISPGGVRTMRFDGVKLKTRYSHSSIGSITPSADGAILFSTYGLFSADHKQLLPVNSSVAFPTLNPAYYLSFSVAKIEEQNVPVLSLFNTSERSLLLKLSEFSGLEKFKFYDPSSSVPLPDRIFAHPAAKKIFVLDGSRMVLHILPFDIMKTLNGKEYFFVESTPTAYFTPGKRYEYTIKVASNKAEKLKYKLESGPRGMSVSSIGVLNWTGTIHPEEKISVITSIENASGQSIFHSFNIYNNNYIKAKSTKK